jgi:pyruvate,water dikinase
MDSWNETLSGDYLWSNVNFGEAITDVMTPMTWSVVQFTLDDWTFLPGTATVGVIGGRPYLNISVFAALFYGIGRSRQDLLDFMESTLYMNIPDDMPIPGIEVSRFTLLRGVLRSIQVQVSQQRGVQKTAAYVRENRAWFREIQTTIASQVSGPGLCRLWHTEIAPHIKRGVWCVLGSASHSANYTLKLRRELADLVGADDANLLIANVSEEGETLDSLGFVIGLEKLARGEISRAAYLEDYGHRGPQEFELSVPRPAEDAAWLERELARLREAPLDVQDLRARQRQAFDAAWNRLQARSPRAAKRLWRRMAEGARRARLRERARSAYVRDRWAVRLFVRQAGELTGLGDQVFYLTLGELLALLAGDHSVVQVIGTRMAAYQRYKALPPYPPVIRGPFDPFAWAADPNRSTDVFDPSKMVRPNAKPTTVVGSPGSAGIVEGTVRVIEHAGVADTLQQGEILVAAQTDVAWTLLFPRASAVVTDVGAPLSHAAIVARELGIPAVVGCGNATTVLKTGDRVRVDGGRGTVELLRDVG